MPNRRCTRWSERGAHQFHSPNSRIRAGTSNARMTHAQIRKYCAVDVALGDLLQHAMEQLHLSARAYDRILKVSRTIADLEDSEEILSSHVAEAVHYRSLDRTYWT